MLARSERDQINSYLPFYLPVPEDSKIDKGVVWNWRGASQRQDGQSSSFYHFFIIVLSEYNSRMLFKSITKIWWTSYLIKTQWLAYLISMIDISDLIRIIPNPQFYLRNRSFCTAKIILLTCISLWALIETELIFQFLLQNTLLWLIFFNPNLL